MLEVMAFLIDHVDVIARDLILFFLLLHQHIHGKKFLFQGRLFEKFRLDKKQGHTIKLYDQQYHIIHEIISAKMHDAHHLIQHFKNC